MITDEMRENKCRKEWMHHYSCGCIEYQWEDVPNTRPKMRRYLEECNGYYKWSLEVLIVKGEYHARKVVL